ncbi:MAG TPA: ATP12 family protein [Rhizomicrobium sp.]|jgi:chaperone required for assembly of F1-ATPase
MNRFYKEVTIAPEGSGYAVKLDGRPLKTPGKATLVLPTPALADAVAEEWRQQSETIKPEAMPLTKSANSAVDTVSVNRAQVTDELLRYGSGDLLCYRADDDITLAERQRLAWDPILAWLSERYGAQLALTEGVVHIEQPGDAILALGRALAGFNPYVLTGVHVATTLTGSLALALAMEDAHLTAEQVFEAAHLDERYQAERWGQDSEAEKRLLTLRQELEAAARFMTLARE